MRTIATALGVAPESIRRWTHPPRAPRAARARPGRGRALGRGATPLTLVSLRGFWVEGLSLADVGAPLGTLG
jgi:hypothetical protein